MLEPILDLIRCLGDGSASSGGGFLDLLLLDSLGVRSVLVQEGEESHGFVLSNGLGELVNGRRHLEALVQDGSLTLDADITRPLNESGEIATGRANVTSDLEGTRPGGEDRIDCLLGGRLVVLL